MRRPAIRNLNSWEEGTQADLYTLTKEQLLALEGFADKKADNLLDALAAASADQLQMVEASGQTSPPASWTGSAANATGKYWRN